jgi:hypothetical protein
LTRVYVLNARRQLCQGRSGQGLLQDNHGLAQICRFERMGGSQQ